MGQNPTAPRRAGAFLIPLLLGLMLSYTLSPIVNGLQRWHIPCALGAAVLLIGIIGGTGSLVYSRSDGATSLIESLPDAAQKLRLALQRPRHAPSGTIDNVQQAAAEPDRSDVTKVGIQRSRFNLKDHLWTGTLGLVAFMGQTIVVILITYFLLVSGDTFRRKMLKLAGPKISQRGSPWRCSTRSPSRSSGTFWSSCSRA